VRSPDTGCPIEAFMIPHISSNTPLEPPPLVCDSSRADVVWSKCFVYERPEWQRYELRCHRLPPCPGDQSQSSD
jgi:hypothetical protein